mmetsp:Transcript_77/g.169  ORF Transcript_77/g.169 Transcript_77/m.169 type:complete len:212 (-) Transcript_77:69-704(-)
MTSWCLLLSISLLCVVTATVTSEGDSSTLLQVGVKFNHSTARDSTSWQDGIEIVQNLQGIGFENVCAINMHYQVMGASSYYAVPSAWVDKNGKIVNENQELAKDWSQAELFMFFKTAYSVVRRSKRALEGVAQNPLSAVVAIQNDPGDKVVASKKGQPKDYDQLFKNALEAVEDQVEWAEYGPPKFETISPGKGKGKGKAEMDMPGISGSL